MTLRSRCPVWSSLDEQQCWSPTNRPVLNRHFLNRHCNRSTNSDILWLARSWSRNLPETVLNLLAPPLLFVVNHFSLLGGSLLSMFFCTIAPQWFSPELSHMYRHVCFPEHCLSPSCCSSGCYLLLHDSKHIKKGPHLWTPLPSGMIVPENWDHTLGSPSQSPMSYGMKRNHLLPLDNDFPLWNSTCRLIKLSLTGKTRSTQKKINTHLFVIFSLSARVCVLMECLSPLWRKMMRSIILHSPSRYRFLFPRRIPVFCKNIDQEFTVSCKGACMCGSCCHYRHVTTAGMCE